MTDKQKHIMLKVIKEQTAYIPMTEVDERGEYVYDMGDGQSEGEVLFHDDIANGVTLADVFETWCKTAPRNDGGNGIAIF